MKSMTLKLNAILFLGLLAFRCSKTDTGTSPAALRDALTGSSVEDIKTLYTSLHNVFFAAYIVDWLAYDIYYKR